MIRRVRVITDHTASYADPIRLQKGERAKLTGRRDIWDGHLWLWAIAPNKREGWVPDTLLDQNSAARSDYDAIELSCQKGERLDALGTTHGWVLCRKENGAQGWVPARHVEFLA